MIINSYQNKSDVVNYGDHAVNALTVLLIDYIHNFDIPNRILIDLYIKWWKVALKNTKFEIRAKRSKLSCTAQRLNGTWGLN